VAQGERVVVVQPGSDVPVAEAAPPSVAAYCLPGAVGEPGCRNNRTNALLLPFDFHNWGIRPCNNSMVGFDLI
jgi:hypothetical protein